MFGKVCVGALLSWLPMESVVAVRCGMPLARRLVVRDMGALLSAVPGGAVPAEWAVLWLVAPAVLVSRLRVSGVGVLCAVLVCKGMVVWRRWV
mgnify:CR=1 FL=1